MLGGGGWPASRWWRTTIGWVRRVRAGSREKGGEPRQGAARPWGGAGRGGRGSRRRPVARGGGARVDGEVRLGREKERERGEEKERLVGWRTAVSSRWREARLGPRRRWPALAQGGVCVGGRREGDRGR